MQRKVVFLALLTLATAGWALAQLPGGYSNAPSDKDYRLTIREPKAGSTITGKDVTIVLGGPFVPTGAGVTEKQQRDILTPTFQIWVDGKDYGNLPIGNNVFTAHDLSYGPHKITVAAKNTAGELVDRQEITITTVASAVAAANPPAPPPAPPAPAPETAPAPAPAPAPAETAPTTPSTLPQTASSAPRALVAGILFLALGLALRRRR